MVGLWCLTPLISWWSVLLVEETGGPGENQNKRLRIPKRQSRMDNPEKLATLGTQNTRRRQSKQKPQCIMC
jgi:hypothetical protein